MFGQLSERLSAAFKSIRGRGVLSEDDVNEVIREIRIALLDADVALPVVRDFCERVKARAIGVELNGALNPGKQVVKIVHEELVHILGGEARRLQFAKKPPTVIMLVGLQGAGKTTLAGKLAKHLASQSHTPLLVAADLQRPNAVDQLKVVAGQAKVAVFAPEAGNGVGDPVKVARDGIAYAQQKVHDIVIVDTAGRLAIDEDMMKQASAIRDAVNPDEVLFVVDAMIGQDAVNTARAFAEAVGFDGVILTKLDGDARGGAALSIREVTGKPILFASTGEKLDDFEVFHPDRMASRILDLGDMLTLIEQAEKVFDKDQQQKFADKMASGESFTLEDFLDQMTAIKNMGPIGKVLGMLPGAGQMKNQLDQIDDKEISRTTAIIQSMTPAERRDPKILNASRRARIANGSGTKVNDVNSLVDRFTLAAKMMKQVAKGGMPQMPGMPAMPGGMPGMPSRPKQQQPQKKKSRSGNPAKRAAEESGQTLSLPKDFKGLLDK
ncbi:MAG: hypothetical protein RIS43_151 [Actinomycetota bacterium]